MAQKEQTADAPVGKMISQALRQEAALFERDGKETQAKRLRALADRQDFMADALRRAR